MTPKVFAMSFSTRTNLGDDATDKEQVAAFKERNDAILKCIKDNVVPKYRDHQLAHGFMNQEQCKEHVYSTEVPDFLDEHFKDQTSFNDLKTGNPDRQSMVDYVAKCGGELLVIGDARGFVKDEIKGYKARGVKITYIKF